LSPVEELSPLEELGSIEEMSPFEELGSVEDFQFGISLDQVCSSFVYKAKEMQQTWL
jgi:hypothetical protein